MGQIKGLILDPETKLYHWSRGTLAQLSPHFSTREFECQCGKCDEQIVALGLVEKLEQMRKELRVPIQIRSGYRCSGHQAALKEAGLPTAKGKSTHELGEAADIAAGGYNGVGLLVAATPHFQAIGVANRWVHVDLRADKVRRWTYG